MNCQECQPLLIDSLLGDLSPEQASEIAHHVETCEACALEWQLVQRDFSQLAETSEPVDPPTDLKARLLSSLPVKSSPAKPLPANEGLTIVADVPPTAPVVAFGMSEALDEPVDYNTLASDAHRADGAGWTKFALLAATLAGVLLGGWGAQAIRSTLAEAAAERAVAQSRAQAATTLATTMQASRRLTDQATLRNAAFTSAESPSLVATLSWDVLSQQLHFHAVGLPAKPDDQTYRLWLIDDVGQWVEAGDILASSEDDPSVYRLLAPAPEHEHPFVAAALALDSAESPDLDKHGRVISQTQFGPAAGE
ncbi:anti-sigma factor [Adhaeretor mobilis]|uniref:Uncharacterized protein n=1 Tax=Adhaeretor mobilis TaxID=1930276 RepID=A0A517N2H4_9BACT|nr:anti-sigma factor [Adhaeretor mobilis]QDT01332.1 hypothetical protein HG15A2_46740 [Adhaeretor mobilis]